MEQMKLSAAVLPVEADLKRMRLCSLLCTKINEFLPPPMNEKTVTRDIFLLMCTPFMRRNQLVC